MMGMGTYQSVVSAEELSNKQLRDVFDELLARLDLEIVRERTPDYTAYKLRARTQGEGK